MKKNEKSDNQSLAGLPDGRIFAQIWQIWAKKILSGREKNCLAEKQKLAEIWAKKILSGREKKSGRNLGKF